MNIALNAREIEIAKGKAAAQLKKKTPNGVCVNFTALTQKEQTAFVEPIFKAAPFVMKGIDREKALDFVSAAFAKYWEKPEAYNAEKSNFRTFILNSAKNLAIDERRTKSEKMSRMASVKISDTDKDGENITHKFEKYLADSSADFAAADSKGEQMAAFMAKLETLPEIAKNIVLMKLAGHKGQEIADTLNVTLANVKTTQNRAFHKMGMSHVLVNLKNLSQGYKEDKKESEFISQKEIDQLKMELA